MLSKSRLTGNDTYDFDADFENSTHRKLLYEIDKNESKFSLGLFSISTFVPYGGHCAECRFGHITISPEM